MASILFFSGCYSFSSELESKSFGEKNDYLRTSLARLLNHDERLNGEYVGVSGWISFDNLSSGLIYLSKSDYEYNNAENSIFVFIDNETLGLSNGSLVDLEGTLVLVEGKYLVPKEDKKRGLPPAFGDLLRVEKITYIHQLRWEKNKPRSDLMRKLKAEQKE